MLVVSFLALPGKADLVAANIAADASGNLGVASGAFDMIVVSADDLDAVAAAVAPHASGLARFLPLAVDGPASAPAVGLAVFKAAA